MNFTCGHLTKKNTECLKKVPMEGMKCYHHRDKENCGTCSICLETIKEDKHLKLKCHHSFHKECIGKWLTQKMECPYCRHEITDKKTLQWLDEDFKNKDEEWIPSPNLQIPTRRRRQRRRRRRRAATQAETNRNIMNHFSTLIDRITELMT